MRYQLKENMGRHILRKGSQRLDVYAGHIVDDSQWPIPFGMESDFEALDPEPEREPKLMFRLEAYPGGYFDVIHPVTGVAINTKKLRKVEAVALADTTVEAYDAQEAEKAAEADRLAAEEAEAARLASEEAEGAKPEIEKPDADKESSGEGPVQ